MERYRWGDPGQAVDHGGIVDLFVGGPGRTRVPEDLETRPCVAVRPGRCLDPLLAQSLLDLTARCHCLLLGHFVILQPKGHCRSVRSAAISPEPLPPPEFPAARQQPTDPWPGDRSPMPSGEQSGPTKNRTTDRDRSR